MKKRTAAALVGPLVIGSLVATGLGQNIKIGFVNTIEVLYGTEEGKVELEKLNQFGTEKQNELVSEGSTLQQLQEQYSAQQASLNALTRAEMEREIQDLDLKLKRRQEDIQLEFNELQNELLERMSEKIREIIGEYAPENGFGVIFLRNEGQTYVDSSLDITADIVQIYNERNTAASQGASQ
ncbi:MAG: OmpH family outer membrane protein [Acidobacteriota bacterium]